MGIFKRLFTIGKAETNAAIDKLEDPIKMTEQGIKDLKKDLDNSLQALAEVKAIAIRSRKELSDSKSRAESYQQKAIAILKKAESGSIDSAEADRLATEALKKKEQAQQQVAVHQEEVDKFEKNINQLESKIHNLKSTISRYENELKTLKARSKVSEATKKINKQVSGIDSSGTVSMLEKMKQKVAEDEALAEAYGDIANQSKSIDDEIDQALDETSTNADSSLEALKKQLKNS